MRDIPYAFDLMKRTIAQATVHGVPLTSIMLDAEHSLWFRFLPWAIYSDYGEFSKTKRFADVEKLYTRNDTFLGFGHFVFGFWAAFSTFCAWVIIALGRPRVLVYSLDKRTTMPQADFRIERVYEFLARHRIPYTEIFHTLLGRSFFVRFLRRRRMPLYLEGIEWIYFVGRIGKRLMSGREAPVIVGGLESFTPDEQMLVSATIQKYMSVAPLFRFRLRVLKYLLSRSGVRVVFAIDDARHYQEIVEAARQLNIPSYAFQHGQLSPYHAGWLTDHRFRGLAMRSDYIVAWNEYWKNEFLALGSVWPADNIIVAGSPKRTLRHGAIVRATESDPVVFLVPYESESPINIVRAFVDEAREIGAQVIFKLRADESAQDQLGLYGFGAHDVRVITEFEELTQPVTAVIGTYSTFLYDAVETGVPVGLLDTPLQYAKRMVTNNIATAIELGDVRGGIKKLQALSVEDLEERKRAVQPTERLFEVLEGILKATKLL